MNSRFLELVDTLKTLSLYFFRHESKTASRILIVQNAKLGDMVCTTPMFHAIKKHLPNASVAVMGNAINKVLLEGSKDVDEYIVFDSKNQKETLAVITAFDADFACVCTPDPVSLKILMKAKITTISVPRIENGVSPYETRLFRLLRVAVRATPHRMGQYAPREYLRLLEPIGIFEHDTTKYLTYSEVDKNEAIGIFNASDHAELCVAVAPGAGNKIKQWPPERFADVINALVGTWKATVVVIGAASDEEEVNETLGHVSDKSRVVNLCSKLSVGGLKALVSSLDLLIAADTGSVYVAEAFGIPTLDITGPVDQNEQPPKGEFHLIVEPEDRERPQLFVMNARAYDAKEARRQVESVSSERVIKTLELFHEKLVKRKLESRVS